MTATLSRSAGRPAGLMSERPILNLLFASCLLIASTTAKAVDWLAPLRIFGGEKELVIWQGPGQYVKIVEQDRFKKYQRAPKNDHPASISAKEISAVLASLSVRQEGASTTGGTPVFTPAAIALVAPQIADALSKAQSKQDVIFAMSDANGKSGKLTTAGRVFVNEGQFNIILGDTLQSGGTDAGQGINHHLAPYRPGRRRESIDTAQDLGGGPGINFQPGARSPRYDWAIIDLHTAVAAYRGPQIPLATAPAEPAAAGVPEDTAKLLQERQQMREEMARMRKQMEERQGGGPAPAATAVPRGDSSTAAPASAIPEGTRSGSPAPAPVPQARASTAPAATPAPAAPAKPAAGAESVEQRLSILQSLHAKKLITDEEYAAKRKKILEEL